MYSNANMPGISLLQAQPTSRSAVLIMGLSSLRAGNVLTKCLFSMAIRSSSLFRHSTLMLAHAIPPSPPSGGSQLRSKGDGAVNIRVICLNSSLPRVDHI